MAEEEAKRQRLTQLVHAYKQSAKLTRKPGSQSIVEVERQLRDIHPKLPEYLVNIEVNESDSDSDTDVLDEKLPSKSREHLTSRCASAAYWLALQKMEKLDVRTTHPTRVSSTLQAQPPLDGEKCGIVKSPLGLLEKLLTSQTHTRSETGSVVLKTFADHSELPRTMYTASEIAVMKDTFEYEGVNGKGDPFGGRVIVWASGLRRIPMSDEDTVRLFGKEESKRVLAEERRNALLRHARQKLKTFTSDQLQSMFF